MSKQIEYKFYKDPLSTHFVVESFSGNTLRLTQPGLSKHDLLMSERDVREQSWSRAFTIDEVVSETEVLISPAADGELRNYRPGEYIYRVASAKFP